MKEGSVCKMMTKILECRDCGRNRNRNIVKVELIITSKNK